MENIKGFFTQSQLNPEKINELENLIIEGNYNGMIIEGIKILGEKIDKNGNPIWLLEDKKGNLGHFYISKLGGLTTVFNKFMWWC